MLSLFLLFPQILSIQAAYLFDKYSPSSLPQSATPRGGGVQYGYNPIGVEAGPRCGQRFGGALLGRGHGRDLDSNTEYGEYPWHVGVLATVEGDTEYVCGGGFGGQLSCPDCSSLC